MKIKEKLYKNIEQLLKLHQVLSSEITKSDLLIKNPRTNESSVGFVLYCLLNLKISGIEKKNFHSVEKEKNDSGVFGEGTAQLNFSNKKQKILCVILFMKLVSLSIPLLKEKYFLNKLSKCM